MHLQFSISGFMFPVSVSDREREKERPKGNRKPQGCRSKESSSSNSNSKKTNPNTKDCQNSFGGDKHHNQGGEKGRRLRGELKTDDNSEKVGPREHFIASKSPVKRVPPCNLSVKSPVKLPSWANSPLKRASPYKIFRRKGHFCKYCPNRQKFSSRLELHDHIKEKHMEEGDKQFLCNTCSKTFISKRGLDKHSAFHTANLFCRFCKLKLADIQKKKSHEASCPQKTVFKCDLCEKGFSRARDVERHKQTVHAPKEDCHICQAPLSPPFRKHYQKCHNVVFPAPEI